MVVWYHFSKNEWYSTIQYELRMTDDAIRMHNAQLQFS